MIFLITGASGFIGMNTVKYILDKEHVVVGVDNFVTANRDIYDHFIYNNSLNKEPNYSFIQADLSSYSQALKVVRKVLPDYIIHLAAIPSVSRSVENPIRSIHNNVTSTANIAELATKYKVKRLVYAGSSSYYGGIRCNKPEQECPPNCKSPYAASKAAGEMIATSFFHTFGTPAVVLRFFNCFGPYQSANSQYSAVIPAFVAKLLKGEQPIIYGSGIQTRDFTFVKNVAFANYLACTSSKNLNGDIYDVGNGGNTSVVDLLDMIQEILGTDITPIYKPARKGDVEFSKADTWRIRYSLNYCPLVDLKKGLEETLNYYKNTL